MVYITTLGGGQYINNFWLHLAQQKINLHFVVEHQLAIRIDYSINLLPVKIVNVVGIYTIK